MFLTRPTWDETKSSTSEPAIPSRTYKSAGVDIAAGNALVSAIKPLVEATARPGVMGSFGGFGGLFDPAKAGYRDPVLVSSTDGVGTKLLLALATGHHDTIGIDLVGMCANDVLAQGAEPLFFLDYFACGKLEGDTAAAVVAGIAEGCRQAGCALIGGETAEMPGMYAPGHYDLAGFCVGAVERESILPRSDLCAGDVVLGVPSSGAHANGYSLIRRIVDEEQADLTAPAPFDASVTLGDALMAPTRLYIKEALAAIKASNGVKAFAHITGGGLLENVPRVLPTGLNVDIDANAWALPPLFKWLLEQGNVAPLELCRTFNCGIGLVVVAAPDAAPAIIDAFNGEAIEIGVVTPGDTSKTDEPAACRMVGLEAAWLG